MYLVRPSFLIKQLFPKALWRGNICQKKLYLTFDDGPIPGETNFVLDTLKAKKIKATFFCVGQNIEKHPEVFKRIVDEGHAVGNHTFSHMNGWNSTTEEYLGNVEQCERALRNAIPFEQSRSKLFRPPYGKLKRSQSRYLRSRYNIVMWDVLSGDYDQDTSPEKCLKNVMDHLRNGSVIVFHDSVKAARNMRHAMPRFVDQALASGYEFAVIE